MKPQIQFKFVLGLTSPVLALLFAAAGIFIPQSIRPARAEVCDVAGVPSVGASDGGVAGNLACGTGSNTGTGAGNTVYGAGANTDANNSPGNTAIGAGGSNG